MTNENNNHRAEYGFNLKKTVIIKRNILVQRLTIGIESLVNEDGETIMFLPSDCTVEFVGEESKVVFAEREHSLLDVLETMNAMDKCGTYEMGASDWENLKEYVREKMKGEIE